MPVNARSRKGKQGGVRVAFVGIATPKTLSSSPYGAFFDETKSKFKYDIVGREGGESLYKNVQQYIDEAREESDYVIGLGHLGIEEECIPFRSTDVIANTSGFDLFIDGHSHSVIDGDIVKDADGNGVPLVQTGKYFENIGKITISVGEITTELINDYDKRDETTAVLEDKRISDVNEKLGDGYAMFADAEMLFKGSKTSDVVLTEYIKCFKSEKGSLPCISTKNSPLAEYKGYLLDYENANGSGRIDLAS